MTNIIYDRFIAITALAALLTAISANFVFANEAQDKKACHDMIIALEQPAVDAQLSSADFQDIVVLLDTGRAACDEGQFDRAKAITDEAAARIAQLKRG